MELRQLRYFVALAEELHFRRAAERLHITQAPLSVTIQTLERELGAQLFHRTQRRVALTEVGRVFRQHAEAILERVGRSQADMQDLVAGKAGQLQVGFTAASALLSFFPEIVCAFRKKFPGVQMTLQHLSSAGQVSALEDRRIDVGFMRGRSGELPSGISVMQLMRDRLVVAMHRDNPLSAVEALTIADLRGEPMIFYPRKSGVAIYEHFMSACARRDFAPVIVQEALDFSTIVGLAATGMGVAVVPSELRCINLPNVVFKPLVDDDAVTELLLASRAGEASALIASFRHMAQTAIAAWKSNNVEADTETPRRAANTAGEVKDRITRRRKATA